MVRGMNCKLILTSFLAVVVLIGAPTVSAKSSYLWSFNHHYDTTGTRLDTCYTCHNSSRGGPLNPYGLAYSESGHNFESIEGLDSDNDIIFNIDEIANFLTFPGNASDHPIITSHPPINVRSGATGEILFTDIPISNVTSEKQKIEVTQNNTTQEKPPTLSTVNNTTQSPKSPGFESIFAVIGFLLIIVLNKK